MLLLYSRPLLVLSSELLVIDPVVVCRVRKDAAIQHGYSSHAFDEKGYGPLMSYSPVSGDVEHLGCFEVSSCDFALGVSVSNITESLVEPNL